MFITTLRHEFLSLFYQNALMLLSKAEHWKADVVFQEICVIVFSVRNENFPYHTFQEFMSSAVSDRKEACPTVFEKLNSSTEHELIDILTSLSQTFESAFIITITCI